MLKQSLIKIFERDLDKLKKEILLFENESDLWITAGDVNNSPGNLCLHICGNLKHFIGHVLGGTDFIRERAKEFSLKDIPQKELLINCDETLSIIRSTLKDVNEEVFQRNYPINVFKEEMTTEFFLMHLTTHLNYHLGQINYHRRLLFSE
ncbi:MAG: DUF1572 domain-containing protein [Ignavibacteriae bacterium]|nr:DUF1572 domain-containing protein [Ignavibacteriota bacterium]